jgi:hypothetical protein
LGIKKEKGMNRLKLCPVVFILIGFHVEAAAQTIISDYRAIQLESMAEKKDAVPENDEYEQELDQFIRHPVNLNTAKEEDLTALHTLNVLQVRNFISYRKLLGSLISVFELQSVPGWDIETIRELLPYIKVEKDESLYAAMKERWKGGDAAFLIRGMQVLEKSKGFEKPANPGASYYEGTAQKIFIRYTYNYKQLLAFGFSGEKDAGEPFMRGAQRLGFDFYSFHFFLQHAGLIRALAIGDFTVNMGQGLIQWQTTSFTKSSQAMAIKRESNCLRPYRSAGEFNFHRGIGISLGTGNWQTTAFISYQAISTNLTQDTAGREDLFSSFQNSGFHRTASEIKDRNNSRQFSAGGNISYSDSRLTAGINFVHFQFSRPFQKRDEPYNLYSLKGKLLTNYSFDYSYTRGNIHLFGEFATDSRRFAFVQGALMSLSENLDISFLYRNISSAFQSIYSDAFTENSVPANEKGFYSGLHMKLLPGLQADLYYDVFVFPWLKYAVDGPSSGGDILIQCNYRPNRSWHLIGLFKNERKGTNGPLGNGATHGLNLPVKQRWRIETDYLISRSVSFSSRMEFLWLKQPTLPAGKGFLGLAGFAFRKPGLSGNVAIAVFETDGYDNRIYAYEADMPYNFSLPAFYGKGIHYYINLHKDFRRRIPGIGKRIRLSVWLKWGQTFYPGAASVGSGLDAIPGDRKSEIKAQVMLQWQ